MPRLVHKLPKYSFHKSSGQAKVRYGGRDYYLGRHGSPESHKAYSDLINRLIDQGPGADPAKAQDDVAPALLTIAELIERFWEHAKVYYRRDGKPTGEDQVVRYALRPLLDMFPAILASEFKPRHLKLVRDQMIELDWSRRHINASVRRIKRMFNWAVEEELLAAEIAGALSRVRGLGKDRSGAREKAPVGPVSDAHIDAVYPHVSPLVADLIRVMRWTGARPGEVMQGLTVEAIERTDPAGWKCVIQGHKTAHHGKTRTIFIGPRAQEILARRIAKTGTGRLFPITKGGLSRAINKACDRAGIPHWAPNQLRHSAATEIRAKHGLEAAQVILGHSQANTTEIYAEVNTDKGIEIARLVG